MKLLKKIIKEGTILVVMEILLVVTGALAMYFFYGKFRL
jgi:hypothetical protein